MASSFTLITLLSIALFAGIIEARNYPSENNFEGVAKTDEAKIQVMKQLFQIESALSHLKKITSAIDKKSFVDDDFEPWPNVSAYGDDSKLKKKGGKSYVKDFEPWPNVSAYGDDSKLKKKGDKPYVKDFKPWPNVSAYGDDSKLKKGGESYVKDFEPWPSATAYGNDKLKREGQSYVKDFEPRPSVTTYGNDKLKNEGQSYVKNFEPRPSVTAYGGDGAKILQGSKPNQDPCEHDEAVGPK